MGLKQSDMIKKDKCTCCNGTGEVEGLYCDNCGEFLINNPKKGQYEAEGKTLCSHCWFKVK